MQTTMAHTHPSEPLWQRLGQQHAFPCIWLMVPARSEGVLFGKTARAANQEKPVQSTDASTHQCTSTWELLRPHAVYTATKEVIPAQETLLVPTQTQQNPRES